MRRLCLVFPLMILAAGPAWAETALPADVEARIVAIARLPHAPAISSAVIELIAKFLQGGFEQFRLFGIFELIESLWFRIGYFAGIGFRGTVVMRIEGSR